MSAEKMWRKRKSESTIAPWKLNEVYISKEEIGICDQEKFFQTPLCVIPFPCIALTISMRSVLENRHNRDHNVVKKDTEGS